MANQLTRTLVLTDTIAHNAPADFALFSHQNPRAIVVSDSAEMSPPGRPCKRHVMKRLFLRFT